ncbi:MAP kinase-activated protein kinase 2 (Fragment) [Seminavis robusta]|uniref:MAP kinase-activated protein kinase 2 n=1 Tax=Seminavis robusta TaxID=568900 RepID=A0A9N8HHI4_9STRA
MTTYDGEMDSPHYLADPTGALFSRTAIAPEATSTKNPEKQQLLTQQPAKQPPSSPKESSKDADVINPKSFQDCYQTEQKLQSGSYGTVYQASRVGNKEEGGDNNKKSKFAVKVIDRTKLKESDDLAVFREVRLLKELVDVPSVITLVDFFVEPSTLYVVQDLAEGGDLFDRLIRRQHYTEEFARDLVKVLLQTLKVVHGRKIVHRDLKPGNLLLASGSNDCDILLADFGFARHLPTDGDGYCRTRLGTPMYVAPEIVLQKPYNCQIDMWSCGCIIYMLLSGYPPFHGSSHRDLFRRIRAGNFTFHEKSWGNVSVPAKQLIAHLLTVNPDRRWTAQEALDSTWMKATTPTSFTLGENDLSEALSRIRSRRKLKAAMDAVRWAAAARCWKPAATFGQPTEENTSGSSATSSPSTASTKTFQDNYTLFKKVRKGDYATVWECQHNNTLEVYAVKIIPRSALSTDHDEQVLNEVSLLQSVSADASDSIVKLVDFYEEEDAFYIVMELLTRGDVFDRILMRSHYTELDARELVRRLLQAVQTLHSKGIAHRDIKPHKYELAQHMPFCSVLILPERLL